MLDESAYTYKITVTLFKFHSHNVTDRMVTWSS